VMAPTQHEHFGYKQFDAIDCWIQSCIKIIVTVV